MSKLSLHNYSKTVHTLKKRVFKNSKNSRPFCQFLSVKQVDCIGYSYYTAFMYCGSVYCLYIPVGIKRICPVNGSLASWYPIGIGPAGEGKWGDSHGLWRLWCKLGGAGGKADAPPDADEAPSEPNGGGMVLVPVGEGKGFHGWGLKPPGCCLCLPIAIPTGILEPESHN